MEGARGKPCVIAADCTAGRLRARQLRQRSSLQRRDEVSFTGLYNTFNRVRLCFLKPFRLLPKSCKPQQRAVYLKNASNRLPARPNPANEPSDDITTSENKSRLLVIQTRRLTCSCDITSAASPLDKSSVEAPSRRDGQILHFSPAKCTGCLLKQHVDSAPLTSFLQNYSQRLCFCF